MQLLWSSINRKVRNCDFKLCSLTHSLPVTYIYKSRIKETSKVIIDSAYDSTAAILYSIAVTVCIYINKVQCQSICLCVVYLQKSGDKFEKKNCKKIFSNCSQTFWIFLYISEPSKTKISSQVRLSLNFYSYVYKKHHVRKKCFIHDTEFLWTARPGKNV